MILSSHIASSEKAAGHDSVLAAFQLILQHTSDIIFIKDTQLVYQAASSPFIQMTGKSSALEIIGHTDFDIFENPELARRYTDDDRKLLASGQDLLNYIEPLTDNHGLPRYSSTSKYILKDADGAPLGILGISRDITREYLARQRHQKELQYLFELPEDTFAALFMDIDEWRIIRHNRHTVGNNILPIRETMEAFAANAVNCIADSENTEALEFYRGLSRESMLELCSNGKHSFSLEYLRKMPDKTTRWVHVDIHFLVDPETSHQCAIWTLQDMDRAKQEVLDLKKAAEQDEMTGLLNRATTMKKIHQTLDHQGRHALMLIDLDNFKSLNDSLGHRAGDQFLVAVAKVLKQSFRESDIVGRIGGDEFFVLMRDVPDVNIVKEKLDDLIALSRILCSAYPDLSLSLSIGVSMYPANGTRLESLYEQADHALYQAKKLGKNRVAFAPP